MHKPLLLVFSLLLSSSVCLVGMKEEEDRPRQYASPYKLGDSPKARHRIENKKRGILELIAKIRGGFQLPVLVETVVIREAQICDLGDDLEQAIINQKIVSRKRGHTI